MYEEIGEPIEVVAIFSGGKGRPYSFEWRGRKYKVETISLEHQEREGKDKVFCYAVTAANNQYELSFNSNQLTWELERVWTE